MLWRLNQELFPDPGRPIARTTTPFGARGVAGRGAGAAGTVSRAGEVSIGAATGSEEGVASVACPSVVGSALRVLLRPPLPRRRRRFGFSADPGESEGPES